MNLDFICLDRREGHQMNGNETKKKHPLYEKIEPSLIAVACGLLVGLVIMMIFNIEESFAGFFTMLVGAFNQGTRSLGNMLYMATPIILTGLSVGFAFKTGLFNIGAAGQMVIGAYTAIHVGVLWNIPAPFHWIVAIICGALAGALWGFVPGILKALSNVNEVVATIMMNFIGMYLVMYMIKANVLNPLDSRSLNVQSTALLPTWGLDKIFPGSAVNIGILVSILAVVVIHIILNKTTLGYQLKATGYNKDGSTYAGINTKRNIVISMSIAGALAGLAGALYYLKLGNHLTTSTGLLPQGFDGISVALLGLSEPVGALIAGLFLSYIRQGGFYMQLYEFKPEIIDIIISTIIYFSALAVALQLFFHKQIKKMKEKKKKVPSEEEVSS
jgi:general nucleoside transport system permease protein